MAITKPRAEFLALAERCGARITGKPDGSEPIEIVFTIAAWRAFDAALVPGAPDRPMTFEQSCEITQEFRDNDNPF